MIVVDNIDINKNTVQVNETFIIRVTAREVMATWNDTKASKCETLKAKTWDMIKRKIF